VDREREIDDFGIGQITIMRPIPFSHDTLTQLIAEHIPVFFNLGKDYVDDKHRIVQLSKHNERLRTYEAYLSGAATMLYALLSDQIVINNKTDPGGMQ